MSIAGLDPNAPAADGLAGLGDDEIRALKVALQACFPALAGQISNASGVGNNPPTEDDFSDLFTRIEDVEAGGSALFPVGGIIMWSGAVSAIPSGWYLCDGTYPTPDLRDKFIVGAGDLADGSEFDPGNTGGNTISSGDMATGNGGSGSATGTISIPDHTLTVDNLPAHRHHVAAAVAKTGVSEVASPGATDWNVTENNSIAVKTARGGGGSYSYGLYSDEATDATIGRTSNAGQASPDGLSHAGATVELNDITHTHDYMPAYYALAFIVYLGI